ncbi:MAG: ATP-binding protein [Firmicutes bacterium]|nr:ATP-binding protein [Bacillota bacterium]
MTKYGLRRSLKGQPCPICGEVRHKIYKSHPFPMPASVGRGLWLLTDCACIKQQREQERLERERLVIIPAAHPLPLALQAKSFDGFQVTELNRNAFERSRSFARNFDKIENGRGIILLGPSGTGKTHLAAAIANELREKFSVAFVYVPTLLEQMRLSNVPLEPLLNADLLIMDDLGTDRATDWVVERLLIIVDGRLNNLKPTVFTTNYDLQDLDARVGMRVASRIIGSNLHLFLKGTDYRVRHVKFTPKLP